MAVALAMPWCGTAVAAPPEEPPGKSGSAPGHQKKEAPEPEAPPAAPTVAPVEQQPTIVEEAQAKPEKPERKEKEKEKEAARPTPAPPPASVSAPGASGPHKVTICHKGHAITVDINAARAHIDGHGDTYAPAGAKGRAACRTPAAPPQQETTPSAPALAEVADDPEKALVPAAAEVRPPRAPARVEVVATPRPAPTRKAVEGAREHQATLRATLPFTGRSLPAVVLLALGLIAAGVLMRARAPRRIP